MDAALDVIAELGVAKLSMRKVATQLGVSPMAVYKHFANKDELLAAALDEFIARSDVFPPDDLAWDDYVAYIARGMYKALIGEISWVSVLGSVRIGAQSAAVTESFVNKLISAGFAPEEAVRGYFSMIHLVNGAVSTGSTLQLEQAGIDKENRGKTDYSYQQYLANHVNAGDDVTSQFEILSKLPQIEIGLPLLIEALQSRLPK